MAVSSTVDSSVVIGVDMNISDAEKELAKLRKSIGKLEKEIIDATDKRDKAQKESVFKSGVLDEEKAKLQEIKDRLADLQAMSKDKSISFDTREKYKNMIPDVKQEYADQKTRVNALQAEWNKLDASVERYENKINDATAKLTAQTAQAGVLQQQIDEANEAVAGLSVTDQRIVDLNKELLDLKERQKELEHLGVGLGYEEYDQNAARIAEITRQLKEYEKALKEAGAAESQSGMARPEQADYSAQAQARLNAYLEKSSALYRKLSAAIGKTSEASSVLQDLSSVTGGRLSTALQTAGKAAGTFSTQLSGALAAGGPYIAAALAAVAVLKKIISAMMEFGRQAAESIIAGTKAVASFAAFSAKSFVEMLKSIGKFGASALKAISGLAKKSAGLAKRLNVFSKLSDTLREKFKGLGQTIKNALVFSVIYKGLSLVREQMGAYLNVNTEFTTALRRLQGVLLTAFQPIYEVVVPALTTLINVLARAAATVTQFFASLFGTTAKQAQTNAKDLYEQANATTAAGDAAEEAAKQFAGFDEINKLEGNKSAGGGGATSVDTGPLFDYEYDETPFEDWGEAFSAFLDKLLDGIPALRDKFKDFADWLNNLSKKLYDMFTFPGVLDKVKKLGEELAKAFEYLADSINWEQLGRALGAGLNLAIAFLNGFIYGGDSADDSQWKRLGEHLADAINGLVDEVNWYEFGRLLWGGFKIGLEVLAGILENLNMPALANAASNIIMGFFDEMENTINRISWDKIGTQIAAFLNEFQWYGALTSSFTAIAAGIMGLKDMIDAFLRDLNWADIAEQIYTAINDSIGLIQWLEIGETIGNAFKSVFDFVRDIVSGINWYEIGQNIADLILGFDFVSALGSLADLIAAGINAAIKLARGFLDKILPKIQGIAEGIASRFKDAVGSVEWKELGGVIGDGIKAALTFVAGLLDPELFYEIGKAIGDFLVGMDWVEIIGGLAEVLANAIASAVALVNGFLDAVEPNLLEIADGIAQKINQFVENVDWEDLGKTINRGIQTALNFLVKLMDEIDWDAIGDAVHTALSQINWGNIAFKIALLLADWFSIKAKLAFLKLETFFDIGLGIVDGIKKGILYAIGSILIWLKEHLIDPIVNGVRDFLGIHSPSTVFAEIGENLIAGLLQGIKDTWESILDFFREKVEAIKDFFSDAWDAIKEKTSTAWEAIKSSLGDIWDSIKTAVQEKFDAVKEKIADIWDNVKEKTSDIWDSIKTSLSEKWESIKEKAVEIYTAIKDKISEIWDGIKEKAVEIWNNIKETVVDIWDGLKTAAETAFSAVKEAISTVWEAVKSTTESIWNSIWETIKGVINTILGGIETMVNGVIRGLNKMISALNSLHFDIPDWVPGVGGNSLGFNIPNLSEVQIPRLAQGAVIPPNREFMAVLGDQKHGTNIETPLPLMIQAFKQALSEINQGSSRGTHTTILQIDHREFGRLVYQLNNEETQRVGVRLTEART